MPSQISLYVKKSAFMQACVDAARHAPFYLSGEVELDKVAGFYEKMKRKYHLDLPKMEAMRLRKKGEASCRLLLYKYPLHFGRPPIEDGIPSMPEMNTKCFWVLYASEGKHPLGEEVRDAWLSVKKQRLQFMQFELVQVTKPRYELSPEQIAMGKKPSPARSAPSWTWRFTKEAYSELRNTAITYILRGGIEGFLRQQVMVPGFSGTREQLKRLYALVRTEWKRRRGNAPLPEFPKVIPYVRRIQQKRESLAAVKRTVAVILKSTEEVMLGEDAFEELRPPTN